MESFGRYRIEALLGRGGMGEVHQAFDARNERTVALKRLRPGLSDEDGFRARFQRESRIVARLSSPHVIPIHDVGEVDGRLYIDMRLVRGRDLGALLADTGPLRPQRVAAIVGQVADALGSAHDDGLIHRDVKPSNVLLDERSSGGRDFAYLVDFGIAKSTEPGRDSGLTGTGAAIGTLAYMSPEMFLGDTVDRRADVYALACMTFELLAGRSPFDASGQALMYAHLNTPPPRLSQVHPGLPAALDDVLVHGMAKRPHERFATAAELADALAGAVSAPPAPATATDVGWAAPAPTVVGPDGPGRSGAGTRVESRPGVGTPPPWYPGTRPPPAPPTRRRVHPALIAVTAVLGLLLLLGASALVVYLNGRGDSAGATPATTAGGSSATPAPGAQTGRNAPASLAALRQVFPLSAGQDCEPVGEGSGFQVSLATIGCPGANRTRIYYELWPTVEDTSAFFDAYKAGRSSADGQEQWSLPAPYGTQGPYFYGQNGSEHVITATYTDRRFSVLVAGPSQQDTATAFSRVQALPLDQVPG